jgi:hypothetical protein
MPDSGMVQTASDMLTQIAGMVGHPVRVTILDAHSRERVTRIPGVLVNALAGTLVVECLQPAPAGIANAPVTVELLAGTYLLWCHSTVQSAGRDLCHLALPASVQTVQRRRHPRVDMEIPVHLLVKQGDRVFAAHLRDLSAGGASLRTEAPVAEGEDVALVFSLGSGLFFQDLRAVTVRCAGTPDGSYAIGLQFRCSPEQEAALGAWVHRQLEPAMARQPGEQAD